ATERPTGSKVAAARAVITELLDRYSTGMTPWPTGSRRCCGSSPVGRGSGGCSPGISPVVIGAAALRCPLVCSPPPRPDGPGWLDSRMQGYLPSRSERMPVCCVSVRRGLPSGTCADDVRSCRTVMAWFGGGETLGRLVVKVRAGGVSFAPDGQQPFGGRPAVPGGHRSSTEMRKCDRYAVRRHREHSGNGLPLREGHSGVWRSDAG